MNSSMDTTELLGGFEQVRLDFLLLKSMSPGDSDKKLPLSVFLKFAGPPIRIVRNLH